MKRKTASRAWAGALLLLCIAALAYRYGRGVWHPVYVRLRGGQTVAEAVARFGPAAELRLSPYFARADVPYPPGRVALVALKWERTLELWASAGGVWQRVRTYPILAASGELGPKLREGDRQVPEGVYRIESLNPNSSYHLSLKLDYPNAFDLAMACEDGRTQLGGDIFIHGKAQSIGCLAMGDEAIEELFTLVARVQPSEVKVIIAPCDLRKSAQYQPVPGTPPWTGRLYGELREALGGFRPVLQASLDRPDFGAIQRTAASLVAEEWLEENPAPYAGPECGLQGVSVRRVQRADELLSNRPAPMEEDGPWELTPAYLVSAIARGGWWKNTTEHVLVLRWRHGRCDPMLHFAGGWNWRGVDFQIVDIGGDRSKYALLVEDNGCGNQCSQTRTHIFLYGAEQDRFSEVFSERTTWLPDCSGPVYESSIFFPKTAGAVRDIFVQTRVWRCPGHTELATPESTFRWDGQKYSGHLALPVGMFE